jgi:hypothetical protein
MYTVEEIIFMQTQAEEMQLQYPKEFVLMAPEKLQDIANGYGPDRWPETVRKTLTWFFRHYPVPAAIHDLRYELSDGIEPTRRAADAEFAANLLTVWKKRYGGWRFINPLALYERWKLSTAALLTHEFGRLAWQEAYKRNQERGVFL